jgi:hypothetical protein
MSKLEGWIFHRDQGMRRVEFEMEDGGWSAYMDGEIWDLSEEPMDYVDYVDDRVYTIAEPAPDNSMVGYFNPVSLEKWFTDQGVETR